MYSIYYILTHAINMMRLSYLTWAKSPIDLPHEVSFQDAHADSFEDACIDIFNGIIIKNI